MFLCFWWLLIVDLLTTTTVYIAGYYIRKEEPHDCFDYSEYSTVQYVNDTVRYSDDRQEKNESVAELNLLLLLRCIRAVCIPKTHPHPHPLPDTALSLIQTQYDSHLFMDGYFVCSYLLLYSLSLSLSCYCSLFYIRWYSSLFIAHRSLLVVVVVIVAIVFNKN